jgi:hypothetical protein
VGSITNNGNIKTAGTVTVKNNKGIIRNSSSAQMRYETLSSPTVINAGLAAGATLTVNVTFSAAFSSAQLCLQETFFLVMLALVISFPHLLRMLQQQAVH